MQSLAGNEQLFAILERHDELKSNIEAWGKAKELADKRLPVYKKLLELLSQAKGKEFAKEVQSQVDAINKERRLLDASDPLPDLVKIMVDGLRAALIEAETVYNQTYDREMKALAATDSWQKLEETRRNDILKATGLTRITKGSLGNDDEVLASLNKLSLEAWATKIAALPQQFAEARREADRLFEPKIQHVKVTSETLRTVDDIDTWLAKTKGELLSKLDNGPIVIA